MIICTALNRFPAILASSLKSKSLTFHFGRFRGQGQIFSIASSSLSSTFLSERLSMHIGRCEQCRKHIRWPLLGSTCPHCGAAPLVIQLSYQHREMIRQARIASEQFRFIGPQNRFLETLAQIQGAMPPRVILQLQAQVAESVRNFSSHWSNWSNELKAATEIPAVWYQLNEHAKRSLSELVPVVAVNRLDQYFLLRALLHCLPRSRSDLVGGSRSCASQ